MNTSNATRNVRKGHAEADPETLGGSGQCTLPGRWPTDARSAWSERAEKTRFIPATIIATNGNNRGKAGKCSPHTPPRTEAKTVSKDRLTAEAGGQNRSGSSSAVNPPPRQCQRDASALTLARDTRRCECQPSRPPPRRDTREPGSPAPFQGSPAWYVRSPSCPGRRVRTG